MPPAPTFTPTPKLRARAALQVATQLTPRVVCLFRYQDFVVDDDGLGYYDDGEEHLFDRASGKDTREKRKEASGAGGSGVCLLSAHAVPTMHPS